MSTEARKTTVVNVRGTDGWDVYIGRPVPRAKRCPTIRDWYFLLLGGWLFMLGYTIGMLIQSL